MTMAARQRADFSASRASNTHVVSDRVRCHPDVQTRRRPVAVIKLKSLTRGASMDIMMPHL